MGKGRPQSAPAVLPPPYVWPSFYTQPPITVEVVGGDDMSASEYQTKRMEIPWQFRPPMRHAQPFREEVDPMREHVENMLKLYKIRMEKEAAEAEAAARAAKAAKKGGKKKK